ncbi:MAG: BatA domain-containing protein [Planctomycetaceae bacterium]
MFAFSFNLLAFGFASPALLGWLALAAVPVLIHWLFRRRYREVTWAAMQFLHAAARKQSRRTRLEQLLLLLARVLILALIVFAFARPRWADADKLARQTPPTLRVIVLDASLSLGRKGATAESESDSTLFESGKSIAREIVKQSPSGDRFALARIAGSEPRVLIRQPTLVTSGVLDEIDRLPLTFERGDVAATLRQLSEVIASKQPHERCEVVVISDFQAENWAVGQSARLPGLEEQASRLIDELVLIDVGAALPENGAIVGLTTDPPILVAGSGEGGMSVTATLRNTGTVPLTARRVELRIDDQLADSERIDLPLGQDVTVEFTLTPPASGEHSFSVRLEDDSLLADNERWLPFSVRSELSVLLVNPPRRTHSARPRDAATFFVEQALAPKSADRAASPRWLRVTIEPDSELANIELDRHDVVFLCDVSTLTELDVERLRRFVENGGGVILSLGPSVSIEKLNEVAFGSRGLMTLRLNEIVTSTNDDGTPSAFGFDPGDFSHPLLREFRGNPGAGLEAALIRQFVRAEVPDAGRAVALRFSTGDPAIVTSSDGGLGRGRCVLVTTSLDETWGEWAIWAAGFVPLIHELTEYAAAGRFQPREALVGELIQLDVESGSTNITLTTPNGVARSLTPIDRDGRSRLIIDDTSRPGLYRLASDTALAAGNSPEIVDPESPVTSAIPLKARTIGLTPTRSPMPRQFAINVDPRESDPRRIDPREWSESRDSDTDQRIVVRNSNSPVSSVRDDSEPVSDSLAGKLLVAVLALLLVEQALAWRFTVGAVLAILSLTLAAIWTAM